MNEIGKVRFLVYTDIPMAFFMPHYGVHCYTDVINVIVAQYV